MSRPAGPLKFPAVVEIPDPGIGSNRTETALAGNFRVCGRRMFLGIFGGIFYSYLVDERVEGAVAVSEHFSQIGPVSADQTDELRLAEFRIEE